HAELWRERLADEPRFRAAVDELWPYALGVVEPEQRDALCSRVGRDAVEPVERGALDDAFDAIPDPEIPVVSLVDLGVIRSVDVSDGHVRVEFTPTFLGCPALEHMKRALETAIVELGGEPEVEVVNDDSWGTDKITPAGREKLREAGFAPPAPRAAAGGRSSSPGEGGSVGLASSRLVQV